MKINLCKVFFAYSLILFLELFIQVENKFQTRDLHKIVENKVEKKLMLTFLQNQKNNEANSSKQQIPPFQNSSQNNNPKPIKPTDNFHKINKSQGGDSEILDDLHKHAFSDMSIHLLFEDEENEKISEKIRRSKVLENSMEEIVNNSFFLNYTNLTEIEYHCRYILNIPANDTINFREVDFLLRKFLNQRKETDFKRWYRYSEASEEYYVNLENSYIFLINTKILYFNYLIFSREFTDNSIYFWDVSLDDVMTDSEFLNSEEFNRSEAIHIFNNFSLRYNLKNNDFVNIDITIRNLIQSNYENEMFNRTGLSSEEKDLIFKIIDYKRRYKEFLEEVKFSKLDNLENNLGMEMIVNDSEYVKTVNSSQWSRINEIGRNFTNNFNLSAKVNWKDFDRIFNQMKAKYNDEDVIVNDDLYMKFKEVAVFERNYYIWKKNKIENPVRVKKVKTQITNQDSDSLFTDIGKNLHDSLQPLALTKIKSQKKEIEEKNVCSMNCLKKCDTNYFDETDKSKCRLITCECYRSFDNPYNEEIIFSSVLLSNFDFKGGIIKIAIFVLIVMALARLANELVISFDRNENNDFYQKIDDDEDTNTTEKYELIEKY